MSTIRTAAPVIPFRESRTCRCLQDAFREKHRSRQSYQNAAHALEAEGLHVIAHAFGFTAAQESEHAAILQGLLTAYGGDVPPQESAPPLTNEPIEMLRAAAESEHAAGDESSLSRARIAEAEGCLRIAAALRRIAETDRLHARRFAQYLEALTGSSLFRDVRPVSWVCLSCGQLHCGCEPPLACSGCSAGPGHFIRTSFYPFSVEG